jgi:iron uptake system component EfeO
VLRPLVEQNDPELAPTLDAQFAAVEAALAVHASGDGYVSYDTVPEPARQTLARAVDGLGEPLSNLAAAAAGDA